MDTCPVCGYKENMITKLQHNIMNMYVDANTGKVDGVYNREEENITIGSKKLVLESAFVKKSSTPASASAATTSAKPPQAAARDANSPHATLSSAGAVSQSAPKAPGERSEPSPKVIASQNLKTIQA